jgi:hypothetical protein
MQQFWNTLVEGRRTGTLSSDDSELAEKFGKALGLLRDNPFHPGLASHEIDALSSRYGCKVFQSYLENANPLARRMFWVYGPGRAEITIIGLEPHPEDEKTSAYDRVPLDRLPPPVPPKRVTQLKGPGKKRRR